MRHNRYDPSFMMNGALGGLVSITAEPLFPTPFLAVSISAVGSLIVVWSVPLLDRFKIDDVVGAMPVHLFCGIWGTMAVVLCNPKSKLIGQAVPLAIVMAYMGVATFVLWIVLKATVGVHVSSTNEEAGGDSGEMVLEREPTASA